MGMGSRKVGIVGAGFVGATAAYSLAMLGTCHEVILYDINTDVAIGKAIDIGQSTVYSPQGTVITAAKDASDLSNCDVIVITAGVPRRREMTRADLLMVNAKIMKDVVGDIMQYSPNAIILCVSNPLDVMTYTALKIGNYPRNQVVGMAGILDSARMAHFIYEKLGFGAGQIRASVMGGHGDDMVPLPRYSTVAGVPLNDLLTDEEIDEIVERTKGGGAEIAGYLKTGSAYYAPAKATALMVNAILKDTKQVHSCAVYLEGEFEAENFVSGVPVMIGAGGVEKIMDEAYKEVEELQKR